MEVTASDAAVRGVSLPMSSSYRKECRVASEQSLRNSANEELEHLNLGHCEERLIYEQQIEASELNFCSIPVDRRLDSDILYKRFHAVTKQREELQHMEIELRAQMIAGSEIMQMQNNFDAQIKEHAKSNVKLQEQLHEKEQKIHGLERKIEEKERELHAIRLDNEAAWAKEDLLMEQSKKLQSCRRERDNSEAEKARHIEQVHEFMELQEENMIAQESILLKDEQLREAQSWMTRAQEMDALQSTANRTIQAELQDRTEQCNQLWFSCRTQFGEMERLHLHIQQLQLQLADVREKSESKSDDSHVSQTVSKNVSRVGQSNGNQVNGNFTTHENFGGLQENAETPSSLPSGWNTSMQIEHVQGVQFAPSLLGMPTYAPPRRVQPFVMHEQGLSHHSVPSHITQPLSHSVPAMSSLQHCQNYLAASVGRNTLSQGQCLQIEQNLIVDVKNNYEASANRQVLHGNYLDANSNLGMIHVSMVPSPNEEGQVLEFVDKSYYPVGVQSQQSLQQFSSKIHEALRLDSFENNNERKEMNVNDVSDHALENKSVMREQSNSMDDASSIGAPNHTVNFSEIMMNTASASVRNDAFVSTTQRSSHAVGKPVESSLLDERSLLACIVRTIGSGGRTMISSMLQNRLGKVLAPQHWHDYKKKYGKLEDFVASHPELFVIGGDYIQLRAGAQEIIAATSAVAKVTAVAAAAAAASSSSYSTLVPSVAVTPMAQPNQLKKASSLEFTSANAGNTISNEFGASRPANVVSKPNQFMSTMQNGVSFDVAGGVSNIKLLSKPKDWVEVNGGSETKPERSILLMVGNGTNSDRHDSSQSKGISVGRPSASLIDKQQGRATRSSSSFRR